MSQDEKVIQAPIPEEVVRAVLSHVVSRSLENDHAGRNKAWAAIKVSLPQVTEEETKALLASAEFRAEVRGVIREEVLRVVRLKAQTAAGRMKTGDVAGLFGEAVKP